MTKITSENVVRSCNWGLGGSGDLHVPALPQQEQTERANKEGDSNFTILKEYALLHSSSAGANYSG